MIYDEIVRYGDNDEIVLYSNEIYCIRLMLHNFTVLEIADFLGVTTEEIIAIIKNVMLKLNCSLWYETILKIFEFNFLKLEDYLNPIIKAEALNYSKVILENIESKSNDYSVNYIKNTILEFNNICDEKLLKSNKENFIVSKEKYLQLKFKRLFSDDIEKQLMLISNKTETNQIKKNSIFPELGIAKWFNKLKKKIRIEIISKTDCFIINMEVEAIVTASKIASFDFLQFSSRKEKELAIYHELISYYANIEFNYLTKPPL